MVSCGDRFYSNPRHSDILPFYPTSQPSSLTDSYSVFDNVEDKESNTTISFHNLGFSVEKKSSGKLWKSHRLKLLEGISGCFKPGLNAIIGPAGSGKTLLMEVLAGLKESSGIEGRVLVNGHLSPQNFHQKEDMLMGTLTVRENLAFSAALRLAGSKEEKQASVDKIISQLELTKCADSKVGDEWLRGVSGGERRRTNIAMEMLKQPRILFLDEPTSGLDAHTAFSVVSTLHRLALEGRTIILSIHQPRYAIFKLFHSLTILMHGQTVFHGPCSQSLPYFHSIGHPCEDHYNPPDFFLDTIRENSNLYCPERTVTDHVDTNSALSSHKPFTELFTNSFVHQETLSLLKAIEESHGEKTNRFEKVDEENYATNVFSQVKHLSERSFLNIIRNPLSQLTPVIVNNCFALLIGLIFFNVFHKVTSLQVALQNRTGALYFVVANQMYNCISDAQVLSKHHTLFVHEVRNRYYRTSCYLLSKLLCDVLPLKLFSVLLFSFITFFMFGLSFSINSFLIFFYGLFMVSLTSSSLVLLTSACFRSPRVVHLLANFGFVISVLFSGFFSNLKSLYEWLKWVSHLSFLRYSLNVIFISQLKGLPMELTNGTDTYVDSHSATERLDMLAIKHTDLSHLWTNLLGLHLYAFLLLAATYATLRRTNKHT